MKYEKLKHASIDGRESPPQRQRPVEPLRMIVVCRDQPTARRWQERQGQLEGIELLTETGCRSYAGLIRKIISENRHRIVLLAHDDLCCGLGFVEAVRELVGELERDFGSWGVCGNAGTSWDGNRVSRFIKDPHGGPQYGLHPEFVFGVDGNLMLLNAPALAAAGVTMPELPGFHGYDVALSLECLRRGLPVLCDRRLFVMHRSAGDNDAFQAYSRSQAFQDYLERHFRNRRLPTLNGTVEIRREAGDAQDETLPEDDDREDAVALFDRSLVNGRLRRPSLTIACRTQLDRPELLSRAVASFAEAVQRAPELVDMLVLLVSDREGLAEEVERQRRRFPTLDLTACPASPHPGRYSRTIALQAALEAARTDYIWFVDDDDFIYGDAVRPLARSLAPAAPRLIVGNSVRLEETWVGRGEGDGRLEESRVLGRCAGNEVLRAFEGDNHTPVCSLVFPVPVLRERLAGVPARGDYYEDYFLLLLTLSADRLDLHLVEADFCGISLRAGENTVTEPCRDHWDISYTTFMSEMLRHPRAANPLLWQLDQARRRARQEAEREAEERHRDMRHELTQVRQELEGTRRQVLGLEAHNQELTTYIRSLWASRSWRLTKGLRWFLRQVRDLRLKGGSAARQAAIQCYRAPGFRLLAPLIPLSLKNRSRLWYYRDARTWSARGKSATPGNGGKVSIVIPVFNHAEYLERCLASALEQSWEDCEVIVVDDASTDPRVGEILEQYAARPNLTILTHEANRGISAAQNTAVKAASGDIIAFLDCDDYLAADAIERCLSAWSEETVYLHTARVNVDEEEREVSRICFSHLPRQDYFRENLEAFYATHLKLVSRQAFARVGLFESRFDGAQDVDMALRIFFHYPAEAIAYVPEFLYHHRIHSSQTTETKNGDQNRAVETIKRENELKRQIREGRYAKFVSFIMLSFGKEEQTLEAVASIKETVNIPHEIILFDNGSGKKTVDFIKERIEGRFDGVKVFYGSENLGPAKGRREALEKASGDYFVIFDNDQIAEPGWIEELLVRAESDEKVGAVCSRVIFPDGHLQFTGGRLDRLDDELVELGLHHRGEETWEAATGEFLECDWCPIGATLFTVSPAEFLHEGYPNIFEDAGVSFALKRNGYKLLNCPSAWVWHHHIAFQQRHASHKAYMRARYNPARMLKSIQSFYRENGLLIYDEYVWRENGLHGLSRNKIKEKIAEV